MTIHIAFDGLSAVDGSARFAFGNTTAIASVSGPITPRLAAEHPVRATVDVHVRPLTAVPRTAEKHAAMALKGIFERACLLKQHPRTGIQIVVQTLSPHQTDAELDADVRLATQINATTLALLNAGSIPMRGVVCAVVVTATTSQPRLVAELARNVDVPSHAGCFAFLFGVDKTHDPSAVTIPPAKMIWTNYRASPGRAFSLAELGEAEKLALEGAKEVWMKIKESLSETLD